MSETSMAAEAVTNATDQATQISHATVDATAQAMNSASTATAEVVQDAIEPAKIAVQSVTEMVTETGRSGLELVGSAIDQSQEALLTGARTTAGASSGLADIYRDMSERSAGRIQAVFSSYMTLGRGLQDMQHAWLEMVGHTMENVGGPKPRDLLRCKSLLEVADVQREMYLDAVNHALQSTGRLLDLAGRTTQDAVRPLQSVGH